jgi:uncharacterized protein (DUF952 family)
MLIFKIIPPQEWEEAEKVGIYFGSEHDSRDGFLHFSTAAQLPETLRRHYAGAWAVVIVAVNAAALGDALRYEHAPSRHDDFPHLYGPLELVYDPPERATILSTYCTVPGQDFLQQWLDDLTVRYGGKNPL